MLHCLSLILGLAAINLLGAVFVVLDKHRSRAPRGSKPRVPHNTFRLLATLGAAPALLLTMRTVRHKTRRTGFLAALTLLGLAGLSAWALLLWNLGCLPL